MDRMSSDAQLQDRTTRGHPGTLGKPPPSQLTLGWVGTTAQGTPGDSQVRSRPTWGLWSWKGLGSNALPTPGWLCDLGQVPYLPELGVFFICTMGINCLLYTSDAADENSPV